MAQASGTKASPILLVLGIGFLGFGLFNMWKLSQERQRGEYIHREPVLWLWAVIEAVGGIGMFIGYASNS